LPGVSTLGLLVPIAGTGEPHLTLDEQISSWFLQWREELYRYVIAAGGRPAVAEEITQEVFLRLYTSLRDEKSIPHPRFWLYRVAHNLLIDQSRKADTVHSVSLPEEESDPDYFSDIAPSPEQTAIDRQRLQRVQAAMGSMTMMQRNCLYLRAEGFLNREVAQILGIGMSSVADALRRAIRRLEKAGYE